MRTPPSLALALTLAGALGGCREADPYYRHGHIPDAATVEDAGALPDAAATIDATMSCPTCPVGVLYTCRGAAVDTASFILQVTNQSATRLPLADLTLRYWLTSDHKPQALDCDVAKVGCTNIVTSANVPPAPQPRFVPVVPPRPGADEYVEIAFTLGALSLDPGLDTGEIQLAVRNQDRTPINQNDDYSFVCGQQGFAFPSNRVTAYVDGVLVWGLEPPH